PGCVPRPPVVSRDPISQLACFNDHAAGTPAAVVACRDFIRAYPMRVLVDRSGAVRSGTVLIVSVGTTDQYCVTLAPPILLKRGSAVIQCHPSNVTAACAGMIATNRPKVANVTDEKAAPTLLAAVMMLLLELFSVIYLYHGCV